MSKAVTTSSDHVDDLVRTLFGIEPDAMASLAHGHEEVRRRRMPDAPPTTDPLDGVEVFVRRTVATCMAMRGHPGAVSLVTERQAAAAGWPSAKLANLCIVLAWALSMIEPTLALPLLVEAEETAGDAMARLIRVGDRLAPLEELCGALFRSDPIDLGAMERAAAAREHAPALANIGIASPAEHLTIWLGIDVEGVELQSDRRGPRLRSRDARAVSCLVWTITTALDLGSVMEREWVTAVRLKTEHDALLAGEPGALLANCALLLGVAIRHGNGYTVQVLAPRADLATAVIEAGSRIRDRRVTAGRGWEGDEGEVKTIEELDLEDVAVRGYVHVGRANVKRVARRQVRVEA